MLKKLIAAALLVSAIAVTPAIAQTSTPTPTIRGRVMHHHMMMHHHHHHHHHHMMAPMTPPPSK